MISKLAFIPWPFYSWDLPWGSPTLIEILEQYECSWVTGTHEEGWGVRMYWSHRTAWQEEPKMSEMGKSQRKIFLSSLTCLGETLRTEFPFLSAPVHLRCWCGSCGWLCHLCLLGTSNVAFSTRHLGIKDINSWVCKNIVLTWVFYLSVLPDNVFFRTHDFSPPIDHYSLTKGTEISQSRRLYHSWEVKGE